MGSDERKPPPEDLEGMIPDGFRILLQRNLTLSHQGGGLAVGDLPALGLTRTEDAEFYGSGVATSIGASYGEGHGEPQFIALNGRPTPGKVPDFSVRWGLEALFSDWKTRGFPVFMTRLKRAARIAMLPVLNVVAYHYAVCAGLQPDPDKPRFSAKKSTRCLLSLFKQGLRTIRMAFANGTEMPTL